MPTRPRRRRWEKKFFQGPCLLDWALEEKDFAVAAASQSNSYAFAASVRAEASIQILFNGLHNNDRPFLPLDIKTSGVNWCILKTVHVSMHAIDDGTTREY